MTGQVVEQMETRVSGAYVEACASQGRCAYTETAADGSYHLTALQPGAYSVRVWPDEPDCSPWYDGAVIAVTPRGCSGGVAAPLASKT